ncbi:hypothetical protein ACTL6U_02515 [Rhodovibrionaceae bacterium A322]
MSLSQSGPDFGTSRDSVEDLLSAPQHWVGLEEASERLCMPLNHLRLAIDQGLLRANQDSDGDWLVFIKSPRTQTGREETLEEDSSQPSSYSGPQQERETTGASKAARAEEDRRNLERELRLEAREDRLVTLLQESLERREEQLADKDRLLADLSRQFSDLSRDLIKGSATQTKSNLSELSEAQRNFDPERYDRALANIREALKLVRDYLLEQK